MGDPAVGKTALQHRYLGKGFNHTYLSTLGADFSLKEYKDDEQSVRVFIMDLAGHKNFEVLRKEYFVGVSAVLLVFDVTRPFDAKEQLLPWVQEILKYTNEKGVPLAVVANKIDLENLRQIEPYRGINAATDVHFAMGRKKAVQYFETSAKENTGIDAAFNWVVKTTVKSLLKT